MKITGHHLSLFSILLIGLAAGCSKEGPPMCYVMNTIAIDPPGVPFTFHYNSEYQITELSNFSDAGWIGTTFEYNANGNLSSGSNWHFIYDAKNRLIEIGRPPSERTENYTYSVYNQISSVATYFNGTRSQPVKNVYTYVYPNASTHNFSQITQSNGATEIFEYDTKPNPFKSNWPQLGAASFLSWDRPCYQTDNNIVRSVYIEGTTTIVYKYLYEYNAMGYPIYIIVESHVTTPTETFTLTSDPISLTYINK